MAAGRDSGTSRACWPLPSSKCSGRPCLKELGWGDEAGFQHAHTPKKHLQLFSCSDCFWFSLVRETQCLIQHQVHDKYSGSATSQSLDPIWNRFKENICKQTALHVHMPAAAKCSPRAETLPSMPASLLNPNPRSCHAWAGSCFLYCSGLTPTGYFSKNE